MKMSKKYQQMAASVQTCSIPLEFLEHQDPPVLQDQYFPDSPSQLHKEPTDGI